MGQTTRSDIEVDQVAAWAVSSIEEDKTEVPWKTYEEGVFQTIMWLTGDSNDRPDVL